MGYRVAAGVCAIMLAAVPAAQARITGITITRVESPTFEGRSFGDVGQYEKLVGRVTGEVDPADPRNAVITDISRAPRNAAGEVAYATDIMILRPVDRSKGNHKLWYELTNRGAILAFPQINDAPATNDPSEAADAGNGFLMRQGYSVLFSGWDTSAGAGRGQSRRLADCRASARGVQHRRRHDDARQPDLSRFDARQIQSNADDACAL